MNGEGGGDLGGGSVLKRWVNTMIQNDVREKQNHKTKQWTVRSNGRRQNERQQTKRGGMQNIKAAASKRRVPAETAAASAKCYLFSVRYFYIASTFVRSSFPSRQVQERPSP